MSWELKARDGGGLHSRKWTSGLMKERELWLWLVFLKLSAVRSLSRHVKYECVGQGEGRGCYLFYGGCSTGHKNETKNRYSSKRSLFIPLKYHFNTQSSSTRVGAFLPWRCKSGCCIRSHSRTSASTFCEVLLLISVTLHLVLFE